MSICKACGADILWITTTAGKAMPVDPPHNEAGNVAMAPIADGVLGGYVISKAQPYQWGYSLHMPHWASCGGRP